MKLVVLIPAYRAETSVGAVVRSAAAIADHVLVVDDGSPDDTAAAARAAGAVVLRLARHAGKGAALRAGFARARADGAEAIVTLDADGQHDPAEIPRLVACWQATRAGLVIGSRVASEHEMTPLRRFGNRFSRRAVSLFAGIPVPDGQSGFRLYDPALLGAVRLRGRRYELESEVIVKAARAGFRVESVPIRLARVEGLATSHYRPWRDTARICVAVVASRLAPRRPALAALLLFGIAAHAALLVAPLGPALAAAAAFHAAMAWGVVHPRSRLFGPNRSRLPTRERVVALTFDDGPHPTLTPRVLAILRQRGVKATFFLIGKWVERYPEVVREILADGHAVANHTQSHSYLTWALPPARLRREIESAQETMGAVGNRACRHFRAPVGLKSVFLARALAGLGLELISWDVRFLRRLPSDPALLARRLRRHLAPGSILLLHDGHDRRPEGRPEVVEQLPVLLDALDALGYRCVGLEPFTRISRKLDYVFR